MHFPEKDHEIKGKYWENFQILPQKELFLTVKEILTNFFGFCAKFPTKYMDNTHFMRQSQSISRQNSNESMKALQNT